MASSGLQIQWRFTDGGLMSKLNPFAETSLKPAEVVEAELAGHKDKAGGRPVKLRVQRQKKPKDKGQERKANEVDAPNLDEALAALKKIVEGGVSMSNLEKLEEKLADAKGLREDLQRLLGKGGEVTAEELAKAAGDAAVLLKDYRDIVSGMQAIVSELQQLVSDPAVEGAESLALHLQEELQLAKQALEDAKVTRADVEKLLEDLREHQGYITGLLARVQWVWADGGFLDKLNPFSGSKLKSGTETHQELMMHQSKGVDRPVRLMFSCGSGKKHPKKDVHADSISDALGMLGKLIHSESNKKSLDDVRKQLQEHEEMLRKLAEVVQKETEKPANSAADAAVSGSTVLDDAQKLYDTAQETLKKSQALLDGATDEELQMYGEQLRQSVAEARKTSDDAKEALEKLQKFSKDWSHASGIINRAIGRIFG